MKASAIAELLQARFLCGAELANLELKQAFGADMMSDVLAFVREDTVLLTGLVNAHVIRTAEMLDMRCIVFVRGKEVPAEIVDLARAQSMILMTTENTLYTACGLLYAHGLAGCSIGSRSICLEGMNR